MMSFSFYEPLLFFNHFYNCIDSPPLGLASFTFHRAREGQDRSIAFPHQSSCLTPAGLIYLVLPINFEFKLLL